MSKKMIFVQQRPDGDWEAKNAGAQRASVVLPRQADVIERAKDLAKKAEAELVIKGRNGKIREKNSYGNDPCPPKG